MPTSYKDLGFVNTKVMFQAAIKGGFAVPAGAKPSPAVSYCHALLARQGRPGHRRQQRAGAVEASAQTIRNTYAGLRELPLQFPGADELVWRLARWQPDYPPVKALVAGIARGAARRKCAVAAARRLAQPRAARAAS